MTEVYSSKERAIIFSVIFIASFIIALIYLYMKVDYKRTKLVIFALCVIYTSFFVALNIISVFDFTSGNGEKYVKFSKFIRDFYTSFYYVDKFFGIIVFHELIYYFESGQFSLIKKLLDGLFRILNKLKGYGKCKIIIILSIGVPVLGTILVVLIIYKERFRIKSPADLLCLLDCVAIFKIYVSVGFFIIQLFLDWKRRKSYELIVRYYRYSVVKIVNKVESYIKKMKYSFEGLNKTIQNYKEDKSTDYYKYLEESLKAIDEYLKKFELESNNNNNIIENYNLNYNNEILNNNMYNNNPNNIFMYNNQQYNNYIYNNQPYYNNYNNMFNQNMNFNRRISENNQLKNYLETENNLRINTEERIQKTEENKKDEDEKEKKEKEKEEKEKKKYNLPETCIRKYKKAIRRIEKLKKLNQEIKHESQMEINNLSNKKKCTCAYIIRFTAFVMVIITDIFLPLTLDKEDEYSSSSSDDSADFSGQNSLGLVLSILLAIPISLICYTYTIIIIYATKRRRYITGDFLYDKQINDDLSLMKTVQIVCGYSFALLYCNLYFWRSIRSKGNYGRPNFYDRTIIPDYTFKSGISVVMIAKIVVIVGSQIIGLIPKNFFIFKNDLAEYNLSIIGYKYDNDFEFKKFLEEKKKIINNL